MNSPEELFHLGKKYHRGLDVDVDHSLGQKYLLEAAALNYSSAMVELGDGCWDGVIEVDMAMASYWYERAAALGDARGFLSIANMHMFGIGRKLDYTEALKWFLKATEHGSAEGYVNIGNIFRLRQIKELWGMSKDTTKELANQIFKYAFPKLKEEAESGNEWSQIEYGVCLLEGYWVEKNSSLAIEFFKRASDQKNSMAMNYLATCYHYGEGVEPDMNEALRWYKLSAEMGHSSSQASLAMVYRDGEGFTNDQSEIITLLEKSIERQDHRGYFNLGDCYFQGFIVGRDYEKALKLYTEAMIRGDRYAPGRIADCYYYGFGVSVDFQKARSLYFISANLGSSYNQFQLAKMILESKGSSNGETDSDEEAFKWFTRAANAGENRALYELGNLYFRGAGVKKNYRKALEFYLKASSLVLLPESVSFRIGVCYFFGLGTKQNVDKAAQWFLDLHDNNISMYLLGICYYYGFLLSDTREIDFTRAVHYFSTISSDNILAKSKLALCYYRGHGVIQRFDFAFKFYKEVADQGKASGYVGLAITMLEGKGIEKDVKGAIENLEIASNMGSGSASIILADFRLNFILKVNELNSKQLNLGDFGSNYDQESLFISELFKKAADFYM
ncbi:hypothetical protein HK096_007031, partial [Nowakowskiella sp. JEL0078]